jgi:hypothetical protein
LSAKSLALFSGLTSTNTFSPVAGSVFAQEIIVINIEKIAKILNK